MALKNTYDEDKVPLTATLSGGPSISEVKDLKFLLTLKKGDANTDLAPVSQALSGSPPKAVYEYPPERVGDDLDSYDVTFKVEVTPPGKSSYSQQGQDQVCVWPKTVKLTFTSDDGNSHKNAAFKIVQAGKTETYTARDGKWEGTVPFGAYTVEEAPAYKIVQRTKDKGRARSYKVQKTYEVGFLSPDPADATKPIVQFVNLEAATGGWSRDAPNGNKVVFKVEAKDDHTRPDTDKIGAEGDPIFVQVTFGGESKRNDPKPQLMSAGVEGLVEEDSGKKFKGKVKLGADRTAQFTVDLGIAGGNTCKVKIGPTDACNGPELKFENWRKLFTQVTKAKGTATPGRAAAETAFEGVKIKFVDDVTVEMEDADIPAGAWVDGAVIASGAPAKVLVVGTHNVDQFKTKYLKNKLPALHIVLCHYQLDAKDTVYDGTLTLNGTHQLAWPPGGSTNVPGIKIPDTQVAPSNVLFFSKDLRDGSAAIKLCKWTSDADGTKTGPVPADHIVIDQVASGNFVHVKLPAAAAAVIAGGSTVSLAIKVAYAKGWYNGWCTAAGRHNVVKIGRPDTDICGTIVHECGHALQQAAQTAASFPGLAAPPHGRFYTNSRGHQGGHCADGIDDAYYNDNSKKMDTSYASGLCTCVMYGAGTTLRNSNIHFCDKCTPYVNAVAVSSVST
jgi:hypothetical protein